jgi:hypothetical protein
MDSPAEVIGGSGMLIYGNSGEEWEKPEMEIVKHIESRERHWVNEKNFFMIWGVYYH